MRKYITLSPEEVKTYRNMTVATLGEKLKQYGVHKNLRYKDVRLEEPFWVVNGHFHAYLTKVGDKVYSCVIIEGQMHISDDVKMRDVTDSYNKNAELNLEIKYLADEQRVDEIRKIKRDKEITPVMGGNSDCDHEFESVTLNGLTCIKCQAWYCM